MCVDELTTDHVFTFSRFVELSDDSANWNSNDEWKV